MINIIKDIGLTVLAYLKSDWWILLVGILLAVCIRVYLDVNNFKKYLEKNSKISILSSIAFGSFTPFCACGTMAVLLSMFITTMPWGPVMAFLVSSPLTSPSQFMFQTAFFGTNFAIAVLVSSIILGLLAGTMAQLLDTRTNFFKDQFRLIKKKDKKCCNVNESKISENSLCCSSGGNKIILNNPTINTVDSSIKCCSKRDSLIKKLKIKEFMGEFVNVGIKKVLLYFIIFIAIGRIVELLIPQEWIIALFSQDKIYSIPLGATIGLPLYISGSAALPLMKSFTNSGAGQGVLLAFLITGKGTGVPVIAGMLTILKKRAIIFYVLFVYLGGIMCGLIYQFLLNMGL